MHTFFNHNLNKKTIILSPGEYYSTQDDVIIQTLLGSCVSVCLYSEHEDFVGMNHFLLPQTISIDNYTQTTAGKYGIYAMELLLGDFVKQGVKAENLRAKVFGGSNLMDFRKNRDSIGSSNIKFIISFLDKEKIPLVSCHLGGNKGRKILFFSISKKVILKEITKTDEEKILQEEVSYKNKIIKETEKTKMFIFD